MARALLAVLLVAQAVMIANACAFPMHDCAGGRCPSAPCDGVCASVCGADVAQADQVSASEAIGVPGFHPLAAIAGLAVAEILDRPAIFGSLRIAPAVRPPAHIVFCRMLK